MIDALSSKPKKLAQNMELVATYRDGIVAINKNSDLVVYGKDFVSTDKELNGEVICKDCHSVSSSADTVVAVKKDGTIKKYGYMLDQIHISFLEQNN